jgi:hypothetical protein
MKKARSCNKCVDLAFGFPLLHLLLPCLKPGHDADLMSRISAFLADFALAMRPTSAAVEQNHLVNHTVLMRGRARSTVSNEIDSLLGNINAEHQIQRKSV